MDVCVFCQKIAADDVTWHGNVASFVPLNPVVSGHRLFVSRKHTDDAAEAPSITGRVFAGAAEYAAARGGDFNLITSAGESATQTIHHMHVHYVPRRRGDGLTLPWTTIRGTELSGFAG